MLQQVNDLPKGAVRLTQFEVTNLELMSFLLGPLVIAKVQHGIGLEGGSTKAHIFVLKKDYKKSLRILKRVTSTIDYLELSKVHQSLYCKN